MIFARRDSDHFCIPFDSCGYAFARMRFKGKSVLFYFVLLTMMIPFQVFMIPPIYWKSICLACFDTYAGLIIPRMTTAFGIFMMRSFLLLYQILLEEAARIDGLSEFNIFENHVAIEQTYFYH